MSSTALALAVPPLTRRVTDLAGLVDRASAARLEEKLRAYEAETGHQYAILIVPSLEDEALEAYTMRVVEAWKLGKQGKDDGLLLFAAIAERQLRIEVGYGLEGDVPDVAAARVIRQILVPAFRERQYGPGLERALDALMALGRGSGAAEVLGPEDDGRPSFGVSIGFLLLLFFFMVLGRKNPLLALFLASQMGGWGGRRGGGGGGFSGGGGRFGGGGASGGW